MRINKHGLYWTGLLCSTVFIFSYFFLFILGRAVDCTVSFRAHVNIVSLLTYLHTHAQVSAEATLDERPTVGVDN